MWSHVYSAFKDDDSAIQGVNFVYRSVEVYRTFRSYLWVLVRIKNFYNGGRY